MSVDEAGSVLELAVPPVAAAPATSISVDVTAEPASLPEPGGDFAFTLEMANAGTEAVTITDLVADGDSAGTRETVWRVWPRSILRTALGS